MYDRRCASVATPEARARIADGQKYTVRVKVPTGGSTCVQDVLRGSVSFDNKVIDDAVLLKSDGFPTYHLASVVDDHLMRISHIIRGEEWLPSAGKHQIIYDAFGWSPPQFVHLPLLLNPDGSKLSKRQGHSSVDFYEKEGFFPESVLNFVSFLGWNPGTDREIFSKQELIDAFDLERLNKSAAIVDIEKLKWIQQQHIRRMCDDNMDRLVELARPTLEAAVPACFDDMAYLKKVLFLCRERLLFMKDSDKVVQFFFDDPLLTSEEATGLRKDLAGYDFRMFSQSCLALFSAVPEDSFTSAIISKSLKELTKKENIPYKSAMLHLRYALTGSRAGANVLDIVELLGKQKCIRRFESLIASM
ncbi:mitochondrial glutamyl-tRNA synthetase (GluRS) [Andalucia godoyi]|nr:mitochondrial glutamyl-tRNA synthetase (GluRS) [Andalucia godoyi]|eukprot:ANDGO_03222.mRNA.2 mitochondrial glutamyl-tRNA synthetase (GluRS)